MNSTRNTLAFTLTDGKKTGVIDCKVSKGNDVADDDIRLTLANGIYDALQNNVDTDIEYKKKAKGAATIILSIDDCGDATITLELDPAVTIHSGDISGAQALAFTAVASIANTTDGKLTKVECD